ncbi:hypothetical protein [Bdellovibrio sp. NC01]|uniref:hypothetical protein n=1 Tax=Bdellovibrio sp. NC01 TaxID=2220073 RepID=UPI0011590D37|nr:hypothetical protein [Bdellovibrio sp. NC01]QDK37206.1 hypothetical protein DOE51_06185 [Bdellovibrio sp. NC01]
MWNYLRSLVVEKDFQIGILLLAVGSIGTVTWGIAKKIYEKVHESQKNDGIPLSFEYWRLFGGATVPLIMRVLAEEYSVEEKRLSDDEWPYANLHFASGEDKFVLLKKPIFSFFHNLKVKRSAPLLVARDPLWDLYSFNHEEGIRLDFLAKPPDDINVMRWIDENYMDESGDVNYPEEVRSKWSRQPESDLSNQVGFLFFKVKNKSSEALYDTSIEFESSSVLGFYSDIKHPISHDWKTIKQSFEDKGQPEQYLISSPFDDGTKKIVKIPELLGNQEVLFLIAVYSSDKDGFEVQYFSDKYIPLTAEIRSEQSSSKINIRSPYKQAALKRKVPYGWFQQ